MKKLSPAMLVALHYYLGNIAGYKKDQNAIEPKLVTHVALWKRGLIEINDDLVHAPTKEGIEALGGLDAIADRKLPVNESVSQPIEISPLEEPAIAQANITFACLHEKAVKPLATRWGIPAGSIGINVTLTTEDLFACTVMNKALASAVLETGKLLVYADSMLVIEFNDIGIAPSRRAYRFDELEFIDAPVSKLNITPEGLAAAREQQAKTEALLESALYSTKAATNDNDGVDFNFDDITNHQQTHTQPPSIEQLRQDADDLLATATRRESLKDIAYQLYLQADEQTEAAQKCVIKTITWLKQRKETEVHELDKAVALVTLQAKQFPCPANICNHFSAQEQ